MSQHLGDRFSVRRRVAIIVTLGLLTGLGPFTIDMYLPAFPVLKTSWGLSDAQVQLTLSATTLGFALGQFLVGPLSDWIGRRTPLIACSALHIASSVLVAVAPGVEFLTAMRLLQGLGSAGGAVVAMAMARDLFNGRPLVRMLSRLALVSGLAPIIAPVVGSSLLPLVGWRGVFWVLAGYGFLVLCLIILLTVETRPPAERTRGGMRPLLKGYSVVVRDRVFVGALLINAFAFGGLFSYVSSSSVLFQEVFGLDVRGYGVVFAICSVGVFVGVQTGSRLAPRLGPQWVLACSTTLLIVAAGSGLAVDLLGWGYQALVPTIFAYTFAFGASAPNNQVLALQNHRENSGVASSLLGAATQVMGSIVGPIIGLRMMTSAVPMGSAMLACGFFASLSLWLVLQPWRLPRGLSG